MFCAIEIPIIKPIWNENDTLCLLPTFDLAIEIDITIFQWINLCETKPSEYLSDVWFNHAKITVKKVDIEYCF